MPLRFEHGDLFAQQVDALVNTVNCVGVMGKGVALEFKRRWPENYSAYKRICAAKKLSPGKLYIHPTGDMFSGDRVKYIINFPTKNHWRAKSKIEYIEAGLDELVIQIKTLQIRSIAMPPLGCGNGGLDWHDVKKIIQKKLQHIDANVIVLEPHQAEDTREQDVELIPMTIQRAMLLKALGDLEAVFLGRYDRLSLQKIVYLLQELGVPFGLQFDRRFFGPYSYRLTKAFVAFEQMGILEGFSANDKTSSVSPGGYASADEYLTDIGKRKFTDEIIRRLSHLIEGYESPYGLELLTSVLHLAKHDHVEKHDIVKSLQDWNEEKRNKFSVEAITASYHRLKEDRLI